MFDYKEATTIAVAVENDNTSKEDLFESDNYYLNDEDLKECFYPIFNKLKKRGIDFTTKEYMDNEKFIESKNNMIYIFHCYNGKKFRSINVGLSYKNIIYKYFISNELKKKISPYSFGYVPCEDEIQEYTLDKLYEYIENTYKFFSYDAIKAYFERNQYGKKENENGKKGNFDGKTGLIRRFKDWGIDIKSNNYDCVSKCKILLYFFYIEKIKDDKKTEIFKMFGNPTLENVNNSLSKEITQNGNIIKDMKDDISIEIPCDVLCKYNCILIFGLKKIEPIIDRIGDLILKIDVVEANELLKRIIKIYEEMINLDNADYSSDKPNLFELVYLKLIQHENIGRELDILSIKNIDLTECFLRCGLNTRQLDNKMAFEPYIINEIDSKLKDKNELKKLIKGVFANEKPTDDERKKFRTALKYLKNNIINLNKNIIPKSNVNKVNAYPLGLIIIFLQCLIARGSNGDDIDLKIENRFYGYETSDNKSIHSTIRKIDKAFKKGELTIFLLAYYNFYIRLGKKDIADTIYQCEEFIDKMVMHILSLNSIEQMKFKFDFVLDRFDQLIKPYK